MVALMVAPQAGIPVLRKPLRGKSPESPACGQLVQAHSAQWHTPSGTTSLVADGARYRAQHLPALSGPRMHGSNRVPATWSDAPAALAQADPPTMAPRLD